jgi:hypothetical protein
MSTLPAGVGGDFAVVDTVDILNDVCVLIDESLLTKSSLRSGYWVQA